jgi:type IV secretory pathway protease TraF
MSNSAHGPAVVIVSTIALAALAASSISNRDVVLYNHSPSIPTGFYVRRDDEAARGSIVTVRARDVAPVHARQRQFSDDRDRFIKRVAATGGERVCSDGRVLSINGVVAARVSPNAAGAGVAVWTGCRTLREGELLLLGDSPDSFDGRYWGPVDRRSIEGTWRKLFQG